MYYLIVMSQLLYKLDIVITNHKLSAEETEAQRLNTLAKVTQLLISSYKT